MNANELRIGNYVYFPFTKEVVKILGINAHEINGKIENSISFMNGLNLYCEKIEKLKAIDLTDEWLLKLGFLKYKGDNKDFWLNDFEFANDLKWIFWKGNMLENIKYVHQLQDLYFCLTAKELELCNRPTTRNEFNKKQD